MRAAEARGNHRCEDREVLAVPGEVILFLDPESNDADATDLIEEEGGTRLSETDGFLLLVQVPEQGDSIILHVG